MPSIGTHRITLGDTLEPLNTVLRDGSDNPIELSSYTVEFELKTAAGVVELAQTATGVTKQPTQAFTVDATLDIIKCERHGLKDGDQIKLASTTTLPAGLAASTAYYVRDVSPNAFKVEALPGSGPINITDTGTGTHTMYAVGSVQFDFAAANVDTAGEYRGQFIRILSTEEWHHPESPDYFTIQIEA